MHWKDKVESIIGLIVGVAIFGAFFGWPDRIITSIIQWGPSLIVGVIMSGISGELLEKFTGDALKMITLRVPIAGYNFSITLFFIVTILVKSWLFG
jgi:hypothetical protein